MATGNASRKWIGKPVRKLHDRRFVTGTARYVSDLNHSGMLHAAFVRSSHAHALIRSIDLEQARAHPGCRGVFAAADLADVISTFWSGMALPGMRDAESFCLARDKVRYVGEPVAVVLADSRYVAEDLADLIEVDYEPLPPVLDPWQDREGPGRLYDHWPDNVLYHGTSGNGDVDGAFAGAAHTVKRQFTVARHSNASMETRVLVAEYDPGREFLTVLSGHQDVHLLRTYLAGLLGMAPTRIRCANLDVGGGFGPKLGVYQEDQAIVAVARKVGGRPVKYWMDRREDFLTTCSCRGSHVEAEYAFDRDGRILGIRANVVSDSGAYHLPARGSTVEGVLTATDLPGPYRVPAYSFDLKCVVSNKPPLNTYRGVGCPITTFVQGSMLDIAARELGIDRVEIRRRNLLRREDFPYASVNSYVFESGSYLESLEKACEAINYEQLLKEQAEAARNGRYIGIGFASVAEATARGAGFYGEKDIPISSQEGCSIQIDPEGKVRANLGTTTQGQGLDTAVAQMIAEELGVTPQDVTVYMGDTSTGPYGGGAWGSRCTVTGGSAATQAARQLREKVIRIAAHLLEAHPEDIDLAEGKAFVKGSAQRSIEIRRIARTSYFIPTKLPPGTEPGLEAISHYEPPKVTWGNGVAAAVVEVDPQTGITRFLKYVTVEDCGTVINPAIVDGQVLGGLVQGLGEVFFEHSVFSPEGQPLATTFMDYLLPTALDVPAVEMHHIESPSPFTSVGQKGVGESSISAVPGAVASAISDALRPLGVPQIVDLPLDGNHVFHLIQKARAQHQPLGGEPQ